MGEDQNFSSTSLETEALRQQVLDLRRQLAESEARNRAMWSLLAGISQRLQVSSISIKAAVSSLLDYDIFWDGSTQHEFLETIDDSVDQGSNLILLMTLAFRSEANRLEMKPEPHALQEILSTVSDTMLAKIPTLRLKVDFPLEGRPVLVDYGYLAVALRLLVEVLIESEPPATQIELFAVETKDSWLLDIWPIPERIGTTIDNLCRDQFDELMPTDNLPPRSPENLLKLFAACRILRLQNIQLDVKTDQTEKTNLRLTIVTAVVDK